MGPKQEAQAALFSEYSLEEHVPQDHLLRSIDPELLIRMLLVGYCFGIRSEPRLSRAKTALQSYASSGCKYRSKPARQSSGHGCDL